MQLIQVNTEKEQQEFLDIARTIYAHDPNWICPLDREIQGIFDPAKNKKFINGEARRWILKDGQQRPIGRIAAFIDPSYATTNDLPTGGIGFFECVDDHASAALLFDAARKWLADKDMQAMDGPINFGSNDSYWGLLINGFMPQGFGTPYHLPYYRSLLESYGFKPYYHQFAYHLDVKKPFPERFWKVAKWVARKPDYEVRYFSFKEQDKFVDDFVAIYNSTWSEFKEDFIPMERDTVKRGLDEARSFLVEKFNIFAYHQGKPIAFYINLPDINQAIFDFKGKLSLWNILKLLYRIKFTKRINRIRSMVFGVVPQYRKSGIETAIFWYLKEALEANPHYQEIELTWAGDFNTNIINLWKKMNAEKAKEYITFRYLFDRLKPFERYPLP
jgi:hypothetical protein